MSEPKIAVDLIFEKLAEETERTQERFRKAKDVLLGELDTDIATTPYEVVYQIDRVKLKHYKPKVKRSIKTPLLVVY
ncbi:MAG TPA: class III poly(R)-hydroxyalkanoic acid synthase subunit PhaC, partial [Deltaproteobacteria bacterium]|nr:class III poly(R)-hydroxyalkanoic acid synthase subunit PhaC [Deltaproteobacteria bacterium]